MAKMSELRKRIEKVWAQEDSARRVGQALLTKAEKLLEEGDLLYDQIKEIHGEGTLDYNPETLVVPGFSLIKRWEKEFGAGRETVSLGELDLAGISWEWNDGDDGPSFVGKGQIPTVSLDE